METQNLQPVPGQEANRPNQARRLEFLTKFIKKCHAVQNVTVLKSLTNNPDNLDVHALLTPKADEVETIPLAIYWKPGRIDTQKVKVGTQTAPLEEGAWSAERLLGTNNPGDWERIADALEELWSIYLEAKRIQRPLQKTRELLIYDSSISESYAPIEFHIDMRATFAPPGTPDGTTVKFLWKGAGTGPGQLFLQVGSNETPWVEGDPDLQALGIEDSTDPADRGRIESIQALYAHYAEAAHWQGQATLEAVGEYGQTMEQAHSSTTFTIANEYYRETFPFTPRGKSKTRP